MDNEKLLERIYNVVKTSTDYRPYQDLLYICDNTMKTDRKLAVRFLLALSDRLEKVIPEIDNLDEMKDFYNLHKKVCLLGARDNFHLYMLYIEWNREPKKKFYVPRKRVLRGVAEDLQSLADDELDLLAISLPPGSGKTTIAIFFLTWLAGKYPDEPMLTGSHSNSFVRGVYDECLRVVDTDGEYLWHDVFPEVSVSNTNAKDCRIDFGKRKRFETLEFTSIGTGNAGLYRAARLLYCDDLVSGIEVALSKERLDKLWETYTTDLRQRKIGDHCKELHIATRWSVHDVIGRLEEKNSNNSRAKFIVIPAMNENDESNFDYDYGVGFSTDFFKEQRDIMCSGGDEASWEALYMNSPIEREGILYAADELRYYFGLPENPPDAILSICDTKDRGTDYCFMPVAYQYGNDYYIEDCICDNNKPEIVEARLVNLLYSQKVQMCRFESNSAGGQIAKNVAKELQKKGGITSITTKYTTENKETKIIANSPFVKARFLFKDSSLYKPGSDYSKMMKFLTSYTMAGRNKNDDVPDGMAMLVLFVQSTGLAKVETFKRPF